MGRHRRVHSFFALGLALILSFTSVSLLGGAAQAADGQSASGTLSITAASPDVGRPNIGSCTGSTSSKYAVIEFDTSSVGNAQHEYSITATGPVTAVLYQGIFMPDFPTVNCYIGARAIPANTLTKINTGYNNSGLPDFPNQSWYLVLTSENPGSGINATVTMASNLGTVSTGPGPSITTNALAQGTAGLAYSATVSADGGLAPYRFSATGLPAGLTISTGGVVSGITTTPGNYSVNVTTSDAAGKAASKTLPLKIVPPVITLTPTSLSGGITDVPYSATLGASGGTPPYAFTITSGSAPAGVLLDAATGVLRGIPTTAGPANFTVTTTDANGFTGSCAYATPILVGLSISTDSLPSGTGGQQYDANLLAISGTAPLTFSLENGTLPAGVTVGTDGRISGIPTVAGSFNPTFKVTDSLGQVATKTLSLVVGNPLITVNSGQSGNLEVGKTAFVQVLPSGGTPPYAYQLTTNADASWLSIDANGRMAGTPTTFGNFSVDVRVTDKYGFVGADELQIYIQPNALSIAPSVLPVPAAGETYSAELTSAGGYGGYSYTLTSGTLPTGLILNTANGQISGTPTKVGSFDFTVTSADTPPAGQTTNNASKMYTLVVPGQELSLVGVLAQAHVGTGYAGAVAVTGGTGPYTFEATDEASLPSGLTLANNGLFTGTPTAAGSFTIPVLVTDVYGSSKTLEVPLLVAPHVVLAPEILADGQAGTPYSQQLSASGGTAPYTFAITKGELPEGLILNSDGQLTGEPVTHGNASFTVTATDANGFPGTSDYSVKTIPAAVAAGPKTLLAPIPGVAYSAKLTATGGVGPFSFRVTNGQLPGGLTLNTETGEITGIPAAVGSFEFTVTVTDLGQQDKAPVSVESKYTLGVTSATMTLNGSLPVAKSGTFYSVQLEANGGYGKHTFAVMAGSSRGTMAANTGLPNGLTLTSEGVLSGTPTVSGDFPLKIVIMDESGSMSFVESMLRVAAAEPQVLPSPKASAQTSEPASAAPSGQALSSASPDTSLPNTGANGVLTLAAIAGGILVIGAIVLVMVRRRRG